MHMQRFQKTYLSREMTRAMALDHPIGDPHGGPAYGERNEPISAIIAVGTMFATGGAMMAGSIMAGVAFAGAALSLVGNISGNKTLSRIGMVAGLVGGAGMAGLFGEAAQGATWASTFGGEAAAAATGAPGAQLAQTPTTAPTANPVALDVQSAATVPGTNPMATPMSEGLINNAAPQLTSPTVNAPAVTPPAAELVNIAPGAQTPVTGAPGAPTAPGVAAPTAPVTPQMLATANTSTDPLGSLIQQTGNAVDPAYAPNIRQMTTGEQIWQGVKDAGSSVMSLAKSNPGAAYMLGQAASGVSDALSGKTGAQIDALEAQGQLSKAQADRIRYEMELTERRRKQLNTNMSLPLNMTVNPNAVQMTQPGLINGARGG